MIISLLKKNLEKSYDIVAEYANNLSYTWKREKFNKGILLTNTTK